MDAWRETITAFAGLDDSPLGATPARWAFGDAVVHEGDLLGATMGGRVPETAVALALRGSLDRWQQMLERVGLRGVRIVQPDGRELSTDAPDHERGVALEVEPYEVFRGLAGRRSAAQVANWAWSDDPGPYLAAGPPYPFRWARTPILD